MTKRVVQSVMESGQITSFKFLWDTAGLLRNKNEAEDESPELAKNRLERMGLEDEECPDEVEKGGSDVKSEELQSQRA